MGKFLTGFLLPLLLFTAAFLNWSLISLVDLAVALLILFSAPKRRFHYGGGNLLLWFIFAFTPLVILSQVIFLIIWAIEGGEWRVADTWWVKLIGFMTVQSWKSPLVIYYLVIQLLVALIPLIEIHRNRFVLLPLPTSFSESLPSVLERIGSHVKVAFCLLLPAIQLVTGISNSSWISLPFFVCSCIGLVDWSLTSNFLGLFRWWRYLWVYAGFNICLLYVYQLPVGFPRMFNVIAEFLGLYKISATSEGTKICSGLFLMVFYFMVSCVKCDLEEMDSIMSTREGLTEQLLPIKHSFFIRESRSGVRHTNVLLRGPVFRTFSINFFTYGFPVSLFALSYWSFHFASVCAFGLLVYVGYIIFAFPSLFRLHRLNGLLLVFILLWAVSTYIFNVAFSLLNLKLRKDMEIWEMVGFWHYSIPGLFIFAQFCLGILVALGNLVNNSVFLYISDEDPRSSTENSTEEDKEETKVLIVATIAWGLRKCSRPMMLVLIFLIAMKPGLIHAVYMIFFFMYLLSHHISKRIRQALILLCEVHFAMLYALQINLISTALEQKGSLSLEFLSQLGLVDGGSSWDFLEIAVLAGFCAIHNHGYEMLFSFSAVVQHTPYPPVGFSILKAGLSKSVLLSVYATPNTRNIIDDPSQPQERIIASYLSAVSQKFLSLYRSFGTYISFLTILVTVYMVKPNYVSFGYIFLLLFWITGRQLVEKTKRRLWYPLKAYAVVVFILIYSLSIFPRFKTWVSTRFDLYSNFGYKPDALLLENVWESLAVMIVMQLYSYERRQSKFKGSEDPNSLQLGVLGFIQRLLIWHSQKILFVALFYASLSPISTFGFFYLLGLVICSFLPKASRIPSKSFLVYTGFLVTTEYLFQMWGKHAKMFPGQKHCDLSIILGFKVYKAGFWGLEAGLRDKVLVIAACTLQYNVFHWLDKMPSSLSDTDICEEPCPLFVSEDVLPVVSVPNAENAPSSDAEYLSDKKTEVKSSSSWPSFNPGLYPASHDVSSKSAESESSTTRRHSFGYIWGSIKDSHKWNKKQVLSLRMERFEMQKASLKVYLKFWLENMFNLFGLEINMIALLLVSFSLLNAISILYIGSLAACILLGRPIIRKSWPIFVFLFATVLVLEYFALWKNALPSSQHIPSENNLRCHDCLKISNEYFSYCRDCWLGLNVDDPRVLLSYFLVFMLSCFKLRADHFSRFSGVYTYREMISQRKNAFVWRDLSFETKSMWTLFDYLRVYCYCHLLDLVLALILITGTFEYDILHLGYLAFALIFFRMRFTILKKKNKIFMWLRVYNFAVIVLSLAYQSPFVGDVNAGKCETVDYIYEVIGFYKYDYGFRITSRSSLVEIIIFVLISLQSYMFSSQDFDYVFRYLEAEQVGAIVREQEKKAAWKTAQLQHIREAEEKKRLRNLQVEKIKAEMLNLQTQLNGINSTPARDISSPGSEGLRRRRAISRNIDADIQNLENEEGTPRRQEPNVNVDSPLPFELHESPTVFRSWSLPLHDYTLHSGESPTVFRTGSLSLLDYKMHSGESPFCEITELEEVAPGSPFIVSDKEKNDGGETTEHPIISAVQLLGDGVSQVQSIGNQAVTDFANYLNIPLEDSDTNEPSSLQDENHIDILNNSYMPYGRSASLQSVKSLSDNATLQIGKIFRYILSQMRSNNDVVCYCCFLLVFLWSFSLLSMVYLAALFLYALCVNTGPSYIFWVVVLMYTELYILLQYLYQVIIQHCGFTVQSTSLLYELGFPTKRMKSSFVISLLPLFLVYLFTLIQSSITVKDSDWIYSTEYGSLIGRSVNRNDNLLNCSWIERAKKTLQRAINWTRMIIRNCIRYWKSLTQEAESPPYFVQLSMDVHLWPDDGIQPEKIESGINQLLRIVHDKRCKEQNPIICPCASSIKVQSIEKSSENPNVALAVLEVVFASPWTECTPRERYESLTPAADVAKEIVIAQHACQVEEVGFPYPILSVIGGGKREVDLYAYMFGADLSVFFLVAMFYHSVIKNKSEFLEVYQLDQFPKEFVFILMVIFFLIVLDRIIYLCSFATGKVIFYLFNLFLFTYSVTQYAWSLDHSQESAAGLALRAIYLTKAISLVLQAMQIRYGVPHKSTLYRQFLTSNVSRVDYLGYRLYRAVPFLYELRCVLDWSCTTTSLTMYDWLKLEDMNASLYLVKCDAVLNRAGHRTGDKQTKMTKFCNGICLFFILICVIWAPMLIYSSGNPTNIENPIKDASVQFDIKTKGGRLTLYESTLCEITSWTNNDNIDPKGYLDSYNMNDIQLICCQADASNLWLVPDVIQRKFMMSLDNNTMDMKFSWVLKRDRPKGKEVVRYDNYVDPSDLPTPSEVKDVLNGSSNSFRINNTYLRYFRVTGSGDVRPFNQEVSADLVLNQGSSKWWSFYDISLLNSSKCGDQTGPMAIIVSEETPQGLLGETLSKFSIWGIYITFVLAVGRFIRLQCSDLRMRIPFENLPSCDRLIAICEDIYAARAEGELGVEEILYWTLVKIYRSPHMLLEYTKVD